MQSHVHFITRLTYEPAYNRRLKGTGERVGLGTGRPGFEDRL
jgi:hypothetical protein